MLVWPSPSLDSSRIGCAQPPQRTPIASAPCACRYCGATIAARPFVRAQPPLLSPPTSSPPVRPVNRRKTLAGMKIARMLGCSLKRADTQLKTRRKAAPVAKAAETAVCRGLGIIQDGEEVTEQGLDAFASRFKGQVPEHILAAMRVMFKVGTPEDEAIDEALLGHGGAAGLDLEDAGTAAEDA